MMKQLKRLKGVLVRNLVHTVDQSRADPDHPVLPERRVRSDRDGGYFFSLHPVESTGGNVSETSLYVSTICKERCNPSWTDVDYEDMCVGWRDGWDSNRLCVRVWVATIRSPGQQPRVQSDSHGEPGAVPTPRVAPWDRGRRLWECAEEAGVEGDVEHDKHQGVGMGAQVPAWASRGSRCASEGRPGMPDGGLVDSSQRGMGDAAQRHHLHVELALEAHVVWNDWVALETPLAQLRTPIPHNAVLLNLAGSAGAVETYVDETDPAMLKLLLKSGTADLVCADSDSEATGAADSSTADRNSTSQSTAAEAVRRERERGREKEREERERRRGVEREKEKQQRNLLLGNKDSRTPASRGSKSASAGHWGVGSVASPPAKHLSPGTAGRHEELDADGKPRQVGAVAMAGSAVEGAAGSAGSAGSETVCVIPHKCKLRARALEERVAAVRARQREVGEVKAKLEALLNKQVQREWERHAHNDMALRLTQLRRRVREEESVLAELKKSVEAHEAQVNKASTTDTAKAALTVRARALTVLDTQTQRARGASKEVGRRMGIDFAAAKIEAFKVPDLVAVNANGETEGGGGGSGDLGGEGLEQGPPVSMEEALGRHAQAMSTERKMLRELRRELKTRQHYLTAALHSAYPILTAADGVTRTICGLSLPSHTALAGVDEEMLSTALGHACHMVQLMAKYACVCLRYQPIPMSSRSAMRDMTVNATKTNLKDGNDFPLFAKGQDRARLQIGMRMLCQDVIQLVCVHGLVPVEQPYASHSTVLANLHNIVIACRHRFLAAQGGLEALSALDAQVSQPLRVCGHLASLRSATWFLSSLAKLNLETLARTRDWQAIKSLAITMDEGLELLGRNTGGSGGTSRASSDHGGAGSERGSRKGRKMKEENRSVGSEYISGFAKHVDRLIESMMFPTVTTSAGIGLGEGEKDHERTSDSSTKDKKKRNESRGGKERRDGRRRSREAALESMYEGAPADGMQVEEEQGQMDSSLLALGGEQPWGDEDIGGIQCQSAGLHTDGQSLTDEKTVELALRGPADARVRDQTGGTGDGVDHWNRELGSFRGTAPDSPKALYEMFKAAADGKRMPSPRSTACTQSASANAILQKEASPRSSEEKTKQRSASSASQSDCMPRALSPGRNSGENRRTEECEPKPVGLGLMSGTSKNAELVTVAGASSPGKAAEEGNEEEAWAAGIDRWVGSAQAHSLPWVELE